MTGDDRGYIGTPDTKTELKHKFELYEANGVREYWIIHAETQDLLIYSLTNWKYVSSLLLTSGDIAESKVIQGFKLDLEEFFSDIEYYLKSKKMLKLYVKYI